MRKSGARFSARIPRSDFGEDHVHDAAVLASVHLNLRRGRKSLLFCGAMSDIACCSLSKRRDMPMISGPQDLEAYLEQSVAVGSSLAPVAKVLHAIAAASVELSNMIGLGLLYGQIGASRGSTNSDGDVQKELDVVANDIFIDVFRQAPVGAVVSEELSEPLMLDPLAPLAVAMDPVDGSSNIDTNVSIGTIFSIVPMCPDASRIEDHFLQPGRAQLAAGFVIYGPQTSLVFVLGEGSTRIFTLDPRDGRFYEAVSSVKIPADSSEYAINASNYRHWDDPVRAYIDDCVQGAEGPMKRNYNMRWVGSLVADAYRILLRGGIFLYPGDQRAGYGDGRLRLLYEANPVALLVERAGGAATDCVNPILDREPSGIHARASLVFGSSGPVDLLARYHNDPQFSAERAPLFGRRGLMRL
jgi:fructose-1,6-bisphosphatase I